MTDNSKPIDYLREDPEIPNQRFCCISFIEARDMKVFASKEMFMATKFMKNFLEEYEIAKEFSKNSNSKITDEIKEKLDMSYENIKSQYKSYRKNSFQKLCDEFDKNHNPKNALTVSGIKVRGSFRTIEEAQERANLMRDYEPGVNVFVAAQGYWLPYDPENMEDIKAEFREAQLNEIYREKEEALQKAKIDFENRQQRLMNENLQENKEQEEKNVQLKALESMKIMTETHPHHERKENDKPKKAEK